MVLKQLKSEQLDAYLAALTPRAAEFLIREVELDRLKGGNAFPHEIVLERAREVLKQTSTKTKRIASPQRVFSQPFQALLVDRTLEKKQKGRIERDSGDRIWNWLQKDIASDTLPAICEAIKESALSDDERGMIELSKQLYDECYDKLATELDGLEPDTKPFAHYAARLGSERVVLDAMEIRDCMKCASALMQHLARTPPVIRDFQEQDFKLYTRWYKEFESRYPKQAYLLLVALLARCARCSDVLQIVVRVTGVRDAESISRLPAGTIVDVMLHDLEVAAECTREGVSAGSDFGLVQVQLTEFYTIGSAICDVLDLDLRGSWGHRLIAMRSGLSSSLGERISAAPRLLKAALFQRTGRRGNPAVLQSQPDEVSLRDAEFAVNLLMGIRPFLGQLTLHADFARVKSEVEQFLEVIAERILQNIRHGTADAFDFAVAGYPAAGRMINTIFGIEASELYLRRANAAIQQADATANVKTAG